jgi:SPOR domain
VSRGRFSLLLAIIVVIVGAASFVGVYLLLDDGSEAPSGADADGSPTTLAPAPTTSSTTVPGGLVTPTFVVVVSSEGDEGDAQAIRDELTEGGYSSGVLHSDDFGSLEPGFWVAYVGPFDDVATAGATQAELAADGYTESYSRCVGSDADC